MKKILLLLLLVCSLLVACDNTEQPEEPEKQEEKYVPTDTILSFSDENANKVITEPTFDISQYTKDGSSDIKPYQLFASGMCLQRDAVNRIWGKASSTKNIAAEINGKVYYGTVNGREWEIYLPKMNAGGPYDLTIISESGRLKLTNVYIGEVFLCAGQSNMEWQPQHSKGVLDDLYSSADCKNDKIRMLHVTYYAQQEPTNEVVNNIKWKGADQTTIPNFSAVAYIFGKQMQEELGCPVGLIATPVGGSSIEFWLNEANYNKITEKYKPYKTGEEFFEPCLGYNGMLYPLTGLNVRSVVWYQGCSNAFGTERHYDFALNIFIEQCREMFNNENLGFTICELARYSMDPLAYSTINEKINLVASNDPYIVVARNLDQGEWNDIHPKDKHEIGRRAAYETLRVFFKKDKPEPVKVTSYTFNEDGSATIVLSCDATLVNGTNGFEVWCDGKKVKKCEFSIAGNTITVTGLGKITKIRYGYTCEMTDAIKNDVSKMVTVYDVNGFPLDLFIIEAE